MNVLFLSLKQHPLKMCRRLSNGLGDYSLKWFVVGLNSDLETIDILVKPLVRTLLPGLIFLFGHNFVLPQTELWM